MQPTRIPPARRRALARYIGSYEVMRELGSGHFGAVYLGVGEPPARGRQPQRRRLVAIKKLKDSADPESLEALVREFSLLDQVKHRGVVRVFDFVEDEHAVVMEYVHGVTLRKVLEELDKAHEQVFTEAAVEIGCEIADALYQAWTTPGDNGEPLQLVHRDLKPANVMLTPGGEVKILDWGLARVDNSDFRRESSDRLRGSLLYMSPEQARMHEVDHRSDVFALGLILYELLMNRPAYRIPAASGPDAVRLVMRSVEAGDVREACEELESRLPAVGPIISRALQPRPEDRYQNGQDFLVDLRRQLYRDRGSYLQEFCEFFFGSIHDIGDPPPLRPAAAGRAPARGRNPSLEERLRQSMAREEKGSAAADGVSTSRVGGAGRVSGGRSAASPPRASAPSSPGERMSPSSGGGPKRPPVGGGASRATPFAPASDGNKRKLKNIGQRRPDETGMLEMVPLSHDDDEVEAQGDPSATAFFAIPAPKAERARPQSGGGIGAGIGAGGPPPPGGIGAGIGAGGPPPPGVHGHGVHPPSGVGPPPPGMGRPPMGQPPPAAMPGRQMGGPPPPMGGAPMGGIQGPVAGYGGPSQGPIAQPGGSPFQVQPGAGGQSQSGQKDRVKSQVVWVVLLGALLFLGAASLLAVYLVRTGEGSGDELAAKDDSPRTLDVGAKPARAREDPSLGEPEDAAGDTGLARPKQKKKKRAVRPVTSGGGGGTVAAAPPKPKAPAGPATLSLNLTGVQASSVEVTCPSGVRQRASIAGGVASVPAVPQEDCTVFLKGGAPGKYGPVRGGQSLKCTMSGVTLSCR